MKRILLAALTLASLAFAGAAHAMVIHNYDLNGSLADSLGGPALSANGGTLGASGYTFGPNEGLMLSGFTLPADGAFSIALGFSFNTLNGYRKIIDFRNLSSDSGLYSIGSALNFYPVVTGPSGALAPGRQADLTFERTSAGVVTASINGAFQFSFIDSSNLALSNVLNFFIDDHVTGQAEASSGFVDYIRISDSRVSPVPLPAALPLLAVGLAGLGLSGQRRRARLKSSPSNVAAN